MRAVLACLLLSAVAISADLQSDIDEVATHLPLKEIESIGRQYASTFPDYADGLRYIQEVTYEKIIRDFLDTEEGQKLIGYFNDRGIDIESIYISLAKSTSGMIDKWLEPIKEGEKLEPEISGDIMADYKKVIVASDFLEAAHKKMDESPEFANFVAAYKDPEFRRLFYHGSNSKDLKNVKDPKVRGFWKKAFKVAQIVALGSVILG